MLCDLVGWEGGTETYLARTVPEFERAGLAVTLRARRVTEATAFGIAAQEIAWGSDAEPPAPAAAAEVARLIATLDPDFVYLSNVFDTGVVRAARGARRAVARVHDHRMFCPHGDRIYPQFRALCSHPMGGACLLNAVVHGCVEGAHSGTLRRLRAREELRAAVHELDGVSVGSEFMARMCVQNGVERARIGVVPPPVDPRSLESAPAPRPVSRRVLFAGRLVRDKGLDSLVRALGRIPPELRPALDVAGVPTHESDAMLALAPRLGVEVTMLGRLTRAGIDRAIDDARVVAVPSLWPEPFGMVGIEAQARGRPVVAYAVGGVPEWVGEAGFAVRRGDEAALARAIVTVIDDESWERFALAARRQGQAYTPAAHVSRLLEFVGI